MYIYFLSLLVLVYIILLRFLQKKFVNINKMNEFNTKLKELTKEFNEASKNRDTKRMEELSKEHTKMLKQSSFIMVEQIKMMMISLFLFLFFIYIANAFSPYKADDKIITLNLSNNTAYYSTVFNKEILQLTLEGVSETGKPFKFPVFISSKYEMPKSWNKSGVIVNLNKSKYKKGDKVNIYIKNVKQVKIISDNGTNININLPIKIFSLRFIYGVNGVFIFISTIEGILLSLLSPFIKKMGIDFIR